MLSLYRPGTGPWHRMPTAPKTAVLLILVVIASVLPAVWASAALTAALCAACHALPGVGGRELLRQLWALRWVLPMAFVLPAVFIGLEAATVGVVRIAAAVLLAGLLTLTTPTSDLLDAVERAIRPLHRVGVDPARVALLLVVALGAVPALARLAAEVRNAQRARGAGPGIRFFAVPFLVLALRHADDLGDALTARGVR